MPAERRVRTTPHQPIDVTNGMQATIDGADALVVQFHNDGPSPGTVVIRDGEPSMAPESGGGDESVAVAPGETKFIGPLESRRFAQAGDFIWLDFPPDTAGRVAVYRIQ